MESTKLIAKKRDLEGSSNARRLRATGGLPGVIYGAEKEPVSVELNAHDFGNILHHSASESVLVEVDIEGEGTVTVLVKDVQHHPVSSALLHVDLLRIVAGQALHVDIQIDLTGEPEGVKAGGSLDHVMHSISVECLPRDLVEAFEINVSDLEIGQALHVSELGLDAKFKVLVDESAIVATVSGPKAEEEEVVEDATASAEPEVLTEKKKEED